MELKQYSRQIKLAEVGTEGQEKLHNAKVLVAGIGGLGCPAVQYLAAAGVGTLGLADHDRVDITNLHRQILFGVSDVGLPKTAAAEIKLRKQYPHTNIRTYPEGLTLENALRIIREYDLVIDGTDNFRTKYLINDACLLADKPWVYASVYKYEGQLSVFNYQNGPSYRCLFPHKDPVRGISCEETGVLGALTGILGSYQAAEALKIILKTGQLLNGKLKTIHMLTMQEQTLTLHRNEAILAEVKARPLQLESVNCSLANEDHYYLDLRESHEQPQPGNGNVLRIPLSSLRQRYREIPRIETVHAYCQSGIRSREAVQWLRREHGFDNVVNVEGGIRTILK